MLFCVYSSNFSRNSSLPKQKYSEEAAMTMSVQLSYNNRYDDEYRNGNYTFVLTSCLNSIFIIYGRWWRIVSNATIATCDRYTIAVINRDQFDATAILTRDQFDDTATNIRDQFVNADDAAIKSEWTAAAKLCANMKNKENESRKYVCTILTIN